MKTEHLAAVLLILVEWALVAVMVFAAAYAAQAGSKLLMAIAVAAAICAALVRRLASTAAAMRRQDAMMAALDAHAKPARLAVVAATAGTKLLGTVSSDLTQPYARFRADGSCYAVRSSDIELLEDRI